MLKAILFCFITPLCAIQLEDLTLEEKVGQLFIAPFAPLREEKHRVDWVHLIEECRVGGLILKASDPKTQLSALDWLQAQSRTLLLVAADAEWGLSMRMTEVPVFPKNQELGKIQDLSLVEEFGREVGREARAVGIHLNLAPCVDVLSNPLNPVIGKRSFGSDSIEVARRGSLVIQGMQQEGVFACAKHFPGHGDTTVDSHRALPVIAHSLEEMQQIDFPPFREAIHANVAAVMTAHIVFPAIDLDLPATLSPKVLSILRNAMHFEGLIITDALNMKALDPFGTPEEIALLAHKAGADLLLYGAHLIPEVDALLCEAIPRAYKRLLEAYQTGELPIERLDQSVKRILQLKNRLEGQKRGELNFDSAMILQAKLADALEKLGDQ